MTTTCEVRWRTLDQGLQLFAQGKPIAQHEKVLEVEEVIVLVRSTQALRRKI
jgi:hypothetical protein